VYTLQGPEADRLQQRVDRDNQVRLVFLERGAHARRGQSAAGDGEGVAPTASVVRIVERLPQPGSVVGEKRVDLGNQVERPGQMMADQVDDIDLKAIRVEFIKASF
jgi:hypothetical protein